MSKLLKVLYGFAALGLGVFLSVTLVSLAVSHDSGHHEEPAETSAFPDYVTMVNEHYKDYENRSSHFHQTEERYLLPMAEQENCLTCHSLWPHKKDVRTRAFNNQHSRYMTCLGCHIDEQPGRPISLEWYDFGHDNSITKQGVYGITRDADGNLSGAENYISRIVPVVVDGDVRTRVFTSYDTQVYARFRKQVDAGEQVDEKSVRMEAEALLTTEPSTCGSCHSADSDFPWETLGFKGERLNEMRHSAVVGMVEKYESFYFPPVFE